MKDWGQYGAVRELARADAEEARKAKPEACPRCGTPLEYHETKAVYHCIFDGYITNGN